MKNIISIIILLLSCSTISIAQSVSYSDRYFTKGQRTVELTGTDGVYIMSETTYSPPPSSDSTQIHLMWYDQSGLVIPGRTVVINQMSADERNVDLTLGPLKSLLLTSNYRPLSGNTSALIDLKLINDTLILTPTSGTIVLQNALFRSTNPVYRNLYPMDVVYDGNLNQYVICGTATQTNVSPNSPKVAFVATFDINLQPINMRFYNSDPGLGSSKDYDIATKIVVTGNNNYYITGSENVAKGSKHVMGIRNMLINPVSLLPIWRVPIQLSNSNSEENSVDMVEAPGIAGATEFFTLVNSTSGNKWWLLRINPNTGIPNTFNPSQNYIETLFGYSSYGHSLKKGNSPNEIVVIGMKYRGNVQCIGQDAEATPFMATISVNTMPATLVDHTEYNTTAGSSPYWVIGDIYHPSSGLYPVPPYLNKFAERNGPGTPYSVAAPVKGIFGRLGTKLLDVNAATKNKCDDINCRYGLDYTDKPITSTPQLTHMPAGLQLVALPIRAEGRLPQETENCNTRHRSENTTNVNGVNTNGTSIYPNPATSNITVELDNIYEGRNTLIALYDLTGRQVAMLHNGVLQKTIMKFDIPSNIATNVYLLKVNIEGIKIITEKVTINKF